jgi:hypothetical protein
MNMQVRLNRGERRMRRIQHARVEHLPSRASVQSTEPPAARPTRHGGPSLDTAIYNCHCGFVFQASVSTSVGCPHCGGTQAW